MEAVWRWSEMVFALLIEAKAPGRYFQYWKELQAPDPGELPGHLAHFVPDFWRRWDSLKDEERSREALKLQYLAHNWAATLIYLMTVPELRPPYVLKWLPPDLEKDWQPIADGHWQWLDSHKHFNIEDSTLEMGGRKASVRVFAAVEQMVGASAKGSPRQMIRAGNQSDSMRKETRIAAVRAYIAQTYPDRIPAGVTDKAIARATGASDRTVRRARQKGQKS